MMESLCTEEHGASVKRKWRNLKSTSAVKRERGVRKPRAILTSDIHLREDTPTAFKGDFQEEQWKAVDEIAALQRQYDCDVYHAGDLFNHWKPSPWLLSMALQHLPDKFHTVYGQHDLPQHNLLLANKSGINVLKEAGKIQVLAEAHWGMEPKDGSMPYPMSEQLILVWHHMTFIIPPFPGATDGQATMLLKKYPAFSLIVTGDNHQSFATEYEGRLLVNPGPITRQKADQINYKPRVALWYSDTNTIEWHYLPYTEGAISREHIEAVEQRDARIDAFISKLDGAWEAGMSFEENLTTFFNTNRVRQEVKDIVYKVIE